MHTALRAGARPLPRPRKPSAIQFIPHGLIGQDIHLAIFSFFTVLRLYCHFQSVAPEPEVPCASASKKLMWLKVTVPWYKTFKNFSRLFHCSVINVLFPVAFYLSDATFIRYHIFYYLSTGFLFFLFCHFLWRNSLQVTPGSLHHSFVTACIGYHQLSDMSSIFSTLFCGFLTDFFFSHYFAILATIHNRCTDATASIIRK